MLGGVGRQKCKFFKSLELIFRTEALFESKTTPPAAVYNDLCIYFVTAINWLSTKPHYD